MCDIASCPIPYASLCDGIWMGLGVGLAVHGDVRTTPASSGSLCQDKCPRKSACYRGIQQGSALALNELSKSTARQRRLGSLHKLDRSPPGFWRLHGSNMQPTCSAVTMSVTGCEPGLMQTTKARQQQSSWLMLICI